MISPNSLIDHHLPPIFRIKVLYIYNYIYSTIHWDCIPCSEHQRLTNIFNLWTLLDQIKKIVLAVIHLSIYPSIQLCSHHIPSRLLAFPGTSPSGRHRALQWGRCRPGWRRDPPRSASIDLTDWHRWWKTQLWKLWIFLENHQLSMIKNHIVVIVDSFINIQLSTITNL